MELRLEISLIVNIEPGVRGPHAINRRSISLLIRTRSQFSQLSKGPTFHLCLIWRAGSLRRILPNPKRKYPRNIPELSQKSLGKSKIGVISLDQSSKLCCNSKMSVVVGAKSQRPNFLHHVRYIQHFQGFSFHNYGGGRSTPHFPPTSPS